MTDTSSFAPTAFAAFLVHIDFDRLRIAEWRPVCITSDLPTAQETLGKVYGDHAASHDQPFAGIVVYCSVEVAQHLETADETERLALLSSLLSAGDLVTIHQSHSRFLTPVEFIAMAAVMLGPDWTSTYASLTEISVSEVDTWFTTQVVPHLHQKIILALGQIWRLTAAAPEMRSTIVSQIAASYHSFGGPSDDEDGGADDKDTPVAADQPGGAPGAPTKSVCLPFDENLH